MSSSSRLAPLAIVIILIAAAAGGGPTLMRRRLARLARKEQVLMPNGRFILTMAANNLARLPRLLGA